MAISGHKTRSVFDRYNITSEADLQEAAVRLDEYIAQAAKMDISKTLGTPKGTTEGSDQSEERSCQDNSLNVKIISNCAKVAELADAPDLGSGPARGGGSSPPFRTTVGSCAFC